MPEAISAMLFRDIKGVGQLVKRNVVSVWGVGWMDMSVGEKGIQGHVRPHGDGE